MTEQKTSLIDSINEISKNHNASKKFTKNEKENIKSKAQGILSLIKVATSETEIKALVSAMEQLVLMAQDEIPELANIMAKVDNATQDRLSKIESNVPGTQKLNVITKDTKSTKKTSYDFDILHQKNEKFKASIDEFNSFLAEGITLDQDGNVKDFEKVLSDLKMHAKKFNEYDYEGLNRNIDNRQDKLVKELKEIEDLQKQIGAVIERDREEEEKKKKNAMQSTQSSSDLTNNQQKQLSNKSKEYIALVRKKEQKEESVNQQLSELNLLKIDRRDIKVKTKKLSQNVNNFNKTAANITNKNQREKIDSTVQNVGTTSQIINGVSLEESDKLDIPEFTPTTKEDLYNLMDDNAFEPKTEQTKESSKDPLLTKPPTITPDKEAPLDESKSKIVETVKDDKNIDKEVKNASSPHAKEMQRIGQNLEKTMSKSAIAQVVENGPPMYKHQMIADREQFNGKVLTIARPTPTVGRWQSQIKNQEENTKVHNSGKDGGRGRD